MIGRRSRRPWATWSLALGIPVVAIAAYLGLRAGLIQRVYFYSERGSRLEVDDTARVRSVSWSAPRAVPAGAPKQAQVGPEPPWPSFRDGVVSAGCILIASRTQGGDFDIFARELTASGWSAPSPIGDPINSRGDEVTPCLTPDGTQLFFASNRPGGLGGFDLYVSRRGPDGWSEPLNLGPRVNSPYDDTGPALHPSGRVLVFATARPRSFVLSPPADWSSIIVSSWKATEESLVSVLAAGDPENGRRWSDVSAIGALDSAGRDVDPCFSPDGGFLYFASDRSGGSGGFDIHRARTRLVGDLSGGEISLIASNPENAGRPLNSVYDERAPRLLLDGLAIAFQASVQGTAAEDLFESRTREVDAELAFADIPFGVLAENLARLAALAAGGLVLVGVTVAAFRYRRSLRLSLRLRCAAVAVLLHALLLYGFYFWVVSDKIVALAEKARFTEVSVEKMLQAKLTLEAARIDVATPEARSLPASKSIAERLAPAETAGEATASAALAVFEPAGPVAGSELESSASVAQAPIDARILPSTREPAEKIDVPGPSLPANRAPAALPAPERAPSTSSAADLVAAAVASFKLESDAPRQGPVSTVEERAPSSTALDAGGYVQVASTQVHADVPLASVLPPLARSLPQSRGAAPELPAPSRSSEPDPDPGDLEAMGPVATAKLGDDVTRPASSPAAAQPVGPVDVSGRVASAFGATPAPAVGLLAASRPSEGARDIVEGLPPPPRVASARIESPRLPDSEPQAFAATGEPSVADAMAPRPSQRHAEPGPLVRGDLAAPSAPLDGRPDSRPRIAPVRSLNPISSASPVRLDAATRPGVFGDAPLPARSPVVARGEAPSLPEADGGSRRAEGASQTADVLTPSARSDKLAVAAGIAGVARPETASFRPEPGTLPRRPEDSALVAQAPAPRVASRAIAADRKPPLEDSAIVARATARQIGRASTRLPEAPPELEGETDIRKVRATATRKALVGMMGGTAESEDAVLRALRWLARHQSRDGRWDVDGFDASCQGCRSPGFQVDCDAAITSLALLCFLGQNHTPKNPESPFRKNVGAAIDWLMSNQAIDGCLAGQDERYTMYSHGIATLALSEAYILTGDPRLEQPVRLAAQLIISAQHPKTGGWRYHKEPPLRGDTSITGWQVLALTSVRSAGIDVPEAVFERARHWLSVEVAGGQHGGIFGYTRPEEPRVAMTAEGMFARLLLGAKRTDRSIDEAARYIHSETRAGGYLDNLYLLYYGNLALYHYQGWIWEQWNQEVREFLVRTQQRSGPLAGSWDPAGPWTETGGRVLSTCFAALTLEVYYRYLPLYWTLDGHGEK